MYLKKGLSLTLFLFGFVILLYSLYKSEVYFLGANRSYYLTYYLISLFFFVLTFINFFISWKIRLYFIIIFISSLFSFYSIELFLNLDPIKFKSRQYKKETGKSYDLRNKFEIYSDLKQIDDSVVVFNNIKNKEIQSFSGISNSKTIHCNENGYYSSYISDKYGFNNPAYDWQKDFFNYVLIGDSHIHGACVNRPFDISSILRNISNTNTLNLGIQNTGPLNQFAILKEYLPKNFKNLIWVYYPNDNEDLIREIKDNRLKRYLINKNFNQDLINKQKKIDYLILEKINQQFLMKKNNKLDKIIDIIKLTKTRNSLFYTFFITKKLPPMQKEFFMILDEVQKIIDKNDAKLFFVILPTYSQVKFQNKEINKNIKMFKKKILKQNITIIDTKELIFDKEENPIKFYPFKKPGHLNVKGNQAVAELIYKLTK